MFPIVLRHRHARPQSGLWMAVARHLARLDAAHNHMARLASLGQEVARDTGGDPRDLLDTPDTDLPFFFQSRPRG